MVREVHVAGPCQAGQRHLNAKSPVSSPGMCIRGAAIRKL